MPSTLSYVDGIFYEEKTQKRYDNPGNIVVIRDIRSLLQCGIIEILGGDTMITICSQFNKQIVKNLSLEGMHLTREQQK
ncbi:hypothetical protein [Staphylococcus delphini]|uniref:hypothetical protein n=1 Tax=Staphylococcus delphini TaxID=53344 RepID=UPI0021CF545B|nr:hypothetical protein [Staphylococcus delphini]UXS21734.1 hypothetical protein MUA22_00420 [Staphylococcus delphini]UXS57678.1 hypothetical protein MUA44_00420 [Staphylococcus delphini]